MNRERASGPKYDLRSNPLYQVDWHNEASGKRLSATKRRIRWRFGFSNRDALDQGMTGVDCRGEEHEVVLVWSLTSGKRLVIADGQEVYFNIGRRTDPKFETTWSMFGNHIFQVVAHAAPPLFNEPGFRQFDLLIDGMSFYSFPKIFELGLQARRNANAILREYDRASLSSSPPLSMPRATAQMTEQPGMPVSSPTAVYEDLLSTPTTEKDLLSTDAPHPGLAPPLATGYIAQSTTQPVVQSTYFQPTPPPGPYANTLESPRGVVDEFAPLPPTPRTFKDLSAEILKAYTPDLSVPALAMNPFYSPQDYRSTSGAETVEDLIDPCQDKNLKPGAPVLKPTMEALSIVEMEERDQVPLSEMEKAVKTLVNLNDIMETVETPEQVRTIREKAKNQPIKSKALPPTTPEWSLGLRPSLAAIKERTQPKGPPKREVMRTHAFDPAAAQAGMMVVYGAGFGAGLQPYQQMNSFYAQGQQRMYAAY